MFIILHMGRSYDNIVIQIINDFWQIEVDDYKAINF